VLQKKFSFDQFLTLLGDTFIDIIDFDKDDIISLFPENTSRERMNEIFSSLIINYLGEFVINIVDLSLVAFKNDQARFLEKTIIYTNSFQTGVCGNLNMSLFMKLKNKIENIHLVCASNHKIAPRGHVFIYIGNFINHAILSDLRDLKNDDSYVLDLWYGLFYCSDELCKDVEYLSKYEYSEVVKFDQYDHIDINKKINENTMNDLLKFGDNLSDICVNILSHAHRKKPFYDPSIINDIDKNCGHFDMRDPFDDVRKNNIKKTIIFLEKNNHIFGKKPNGRGVHLRTFWAYHRYFHF
jgi:hypothetical protein